MKNNKVKGAIIGLMTICTIMSSNSLSVLAATNVDVGSVPSTSSSDWKTKKKVFAWKSETDGDKEEVYTLYQSGNTGYSSWKTVTDNFYHTKGQTDLHAGVSTSKQYTFTATGGGNYRDIIGQIGFAASATTSKTVTADIDKNKETGYYSFQARANKIAVRDGENRCWYHKENGKWKKTNSMTTYGKSNAVINKTSSSTGIYYQWRKQ